MAPQRARLMGSKMHPPLITSLAGILLFATAGVRAEDWWFSAGPVYRGGMDVSVQGTSRTQEGGVHAANTLSAPSSVGPSDSYANRTYDDGYVNIDPGTGNASSIDPSVTWYWGYDGSGQYNASAGTLTFHRNGAQGYQQVRNTSLSADDTMDGYGAELVAGLPLRQGERLSCDLCVGVQGIFGAEAQTGGSSYEEGIGRMDVVDTYNVSGISIPSAPYRGTYAGPFDTSPVIPSPTIPNIPASRSSTVGALSWSARNQVDLKLKTDLFELWVGPRLALRPTDSLSLHLTPRVTANVVDVSVKRTETFASYQGGTASTVYGTWTDSASEQDVVFGAGADLGADLQLAGGFFAGVWGGYDWVGNEVDVQAGPNTVSVDVSGYSAGVAVGYRFGQ